MQTSMHTAADGRALDIPGTAFLEKAGSDDLGGGAAVLVQTVPPAGGPPAHFQRDTDEFFVMLEGELAVRVDRARLQLRQDLDGPESIVARHGIQPADKPA